MPPSPTTIPTSFVPKQPVRPGSSYTKSGGNTFMIVALVLLGLSIVGAGVVFGYEQYLTSQRDTKAQAVKTAQENLSSATVEEFIRTRNRFSAANSLLDNHIASSRFFSLLENLTLTNVRFSSLSFKLDDEHAGHIMMDGVARTFNALAAQSSAFAGEKQIQRAIFSNIAVSPSGAVTFVLTADLDPRLLSFSEKELPAPAQDTSAEMLDAEPASTTPEALPEQTTPVAPTGETPAPAAPNL